MQFWEGIRCTLANILFQLQVATVLPQKFVTPPELDSGNDLNAKVIASLLPLLAVCLQPHGAGLS